jgi:membrane-bound acyltransferase YfiQ involved in biofilm formation
MALVVVFYCYFAIVSVCDKIHTINIYTLDVLQLINIHIEQLVTLRSSNNGKKIVNLSLSAKQLIIKQTASLVGVNGRVKITRMNINVMIKN